MKSSPIRSALFSLKSHFGRSDWGLKKAIGPAAGGSPPP